MRLREIGTSGIMISPIMLGGNVFGWTADEATSFSILDAFVDAGFNAIDTSDAYSIWIPRHVGGESETVIGKWLRRRDKRADVVIATKVGARPVAPGDGSRAEWTPDLSARYILDSVDAALSRLQTDYIDLYQSHVDDANTPIEETLRAYETLISAGKVRAIGASNFSVERLSTSIDVAERDGLPRYESCQSCYNLLDRDVEAGLQAECEARNVGLLCYSALAKGFLSGRYRTSSQVDASEWREYLQAYTNERGFRALDVLSEIAEQRDATLTQIALAWLLAKPAVTAAIVGINHVEQLREIAVAQSVCLTAEEIASLDRSTSQAS
ncbi:aldo/keto reductase [Sphingobium fuliginis ATCC 27551]|uniref:Aldo/keto reductase n=2 Tax=Sphingobium fuliginis (strain ATCC 27551) TaxID=336203 RepID=A0A5B8CHW6_SPHSA|nr:aldo/keto reductase [Sphingobium fuliginis ATCC 27551]